MLLVWSVLASHFCVAAVVRCLARPRLSLLVSAHYDHSISSPPRLASSIVDHPPTDFQPLAANSSSFTSSSRPPSVMSASTTQILVLALYKSMGQDVHPLRLASVSDLSAFK